MGIMKVVQKCGECYKGENNCLLTLTMKERCRGPYKSKQVQIAQLRATLTAHRGAVKEILKEKREARHVS